MRHVCLQIMSALEALSRVPQLVGAVPPHARTSVTPAVAEEDGGGSGGGGVGGGGVGGVVVVVVVRLWIVQLLPGQQHHQHQVPC